MTLIAVEADCNIPPCNPFLILWFQRKSFYTKLSWLVEKLAKKKNMQELHPEYSRTQPSLSFFPSNLTQSESIPQPRDRQTLWRLSSLDVWFLLVSIAKIMQRYRCCIFHWLWQEPRTMLFIIRGLFVCPRVPVGPWPAPRSTPRGLGARGQDPITPPPHAAPLWVHPRWASPPRSDRFIVLFFSFGDTLRRMG